MRHLRLCWRFVTGFLWSALVALVSGYIVLNEAYLDAFDEWRK